MPRSRPIAEAASRMPPLRSSSRSWSVVGWSATRVGGIRTANPAATANTTAASTRTPWLPATATAMPPGMAATNPITPDRNDSFELASTSSSSDSTTVGTMADLATW